MYNNKINVNYLPTVSLQPYSRNARTHSPKQIQQIAKSITAFGFTNPVLIGADRTIIAGHGRVAAAKLLGLEQVPTICLEHLSESQRRAYIIADNRLAEKAGWDKDILAIELQNLVNLDFELDITLTGFSIPEVDFLIQGLSDTSDLDELPEPDKTPPVAQLGDLWALGEHRIYCGSSLELESYQKLLGEAKAQVVFTDPPYNVPIAGHVCGKGRVTHTEFAMASGEMSPDQFQGFLSDVCANMTKFSYDGSIHYICMDWRHMVELMAAGEKHYSELKNLCVWNKDNGGMGSLYRSKHELIFVYKNGTQPHINNVELGKNGRYRTNVWDYPGVNSLRKERSEELAMHPTVKPVAMVADAILDCSERGGLVLDPFGGSGTTLMAAEVTGRKAALIELEPKYVDVTIQRWEKKTGKKAVKLEGSIHV